MWHSIEEIYLTPSLVAFDAHSERRVADKNSQATLKQGWLKSLDSIV